MFGQLGDLLGFRIRVSKEIDLLVSETAIRKAALFPALGAAAGQVCQVFGWAGLRQAVETLPRNI